VTKKIRQKKSGLGKIFKIIIFFTILSNSVYAQIKNSEFKEFFFAELLEHYELSDFKSGNFSSAIRGDTLFAVFYSTIINDLILVPIGCMSSESALFTFDDSVQPSYFKGLRETNGIVSSKLESTYSIDGNRIFIFKQTLGQHIKLKKDENMSAYTHERIIFYSLSKGIYKVEYSDKPISNEPPPWPYMEGDFLFD